MFLGYPGPKGEQGRVGFIGPKGEKGNQGLMGLKVNKKQTKNYFKTNVL